MNNSPHTHIPRSCQCMMNKILPYTYRDDKILPLYCVLFGSYHPSYILCFLQLNDKFLTNKILEVFFGLSFDHDNKDIFLGCECLNLTYMEKP